ncbi:GGDEF domain-containing protein [Actinomycetospora lemnae]|uniref:GGDEF domain-containing protein n=1 Tax=Actinomycetospora lemnae TaxID=3019891 RepID=A0ABT5SV84_9PSEU|nr:GGDEF domain-containing protein [Actinomycetospora sp. DW7H6]MDD7966699.1 GGDEF domain-containing protein [Actinomycetospora sp. DW7H6]
MPADHGRARTQVLPLALDADAGARADARAALLARTGAAVRAAGLVPSPDPVGSTRELDAVLDTPAARESAPGTRALLLRQSLVARVLLAAEPGSPPVPPAPLDDQLDELLALATEHGLSLFAADAQMLRARRALLVDDEDAALTAVATGLAHLEEPVLVDHAPTAAEHRHNVRCARRLAAGTLVTLGLHDLAGTLVDQAWGSTPTEIDGASPCGYDRVRLGISWGLRLERAGRPGGDRLATAAAVAATLRPATPDQQPLLVAAAVLADPARGPAPTDAERERARRDAAVLGRGDPVPSQHDRLLVELARSRALERAGEDDAAVAVLAARRAHPPRGEASLMLSVTRELARLRTRVAVHGRRAAEAALGDYVADLEAELWALHRARALSLRTGLAHDRLRREHGQVTALALADPLTGLPNRRALDRHLEEVLGRRSAAELDRVDGRRSAAELDRVDGRRSAAELDRVDGRRSDATPVGVAVAMVDVDRFKQINDTASHARGDEVLRGVATALRSSLRAPDLVARYGGDEFVVVLPDTAVGDAAAALGRARAAVAALPGAGAVSGPVTLSVGVVAARDGEGPAEVLARADAAMYAAKRAGGDAVRTHDASATRARP